jgi:hypothetical protein
MVSRYSAEQLLRQFKPITNLLRLFDCRPLHFFLYNRLFRQPPASKAEVEWFERMRHRHQARAEQF